MGALLGAGPVWRLCFSDIRTKATVESRIKLLSHPAVAFVQSYRKREVHGAFGSDMSFTIQAKYTMTLPVFFCPKPEDVAR